jgi:uncharacterized protein YraI
MRRISTILLFTTLGLLLIAPTSALSQAPPSSGGEACPALVLSAYTTTADLCESTGRNQACYGHSLLEAKPQPNVSAFKFDQEGDVANVGQIQSLRLSVMDDTTGAWGITLMRLQANMPDSQPAKNVTLLLVGDVEINADTTTTTTQAAYIHARGNVNVRQSPTVDSGVIVSLPPGRQVTVDGRLADNSWIRARLPNNGGTGWIAGSLLTSAEDFAALDVVDASSRYHMPMQAFTFKSGSNDAPCAEAPDSGIMIKTPEGMGKVTLLINEVDIQIGSTVFLQAQPGGDMSILVTEGSVEVGAFGSTVQVPMGEQATVPMGESLQASGPPTPPTSFDPASVSALPVELLEKLTPPLPEPIPGGPEIVDPPDVEHGVIGPGGTTTGTGGTTVGTGETPGDGSETPPPPGKEDHKVTICHKGHTITIDEHALPAHLAHGDTLGPCP